MRTEHEKVLDILFEKRVDIDDLLESEDYDDFKELTEKYYDRYIIPKFNKQDWLKNWLLTESEYSLVKNYYNENYED